MANWPAVNQGGYAPPPTGYAAPAPVAAPYNTNAAPPPADGMTEIQRLLLAQSLRGKDPQAGAARGAGAAQPSGLYAGLSAITPFIQAWGQKMAADKAAGAAARPASGSFTAGPANMAP